MINASNDLDKDKPVLTVCSKLDCPLIIEDFLTDKYYDEISEMKGNKGGHIQYLDNIDFFMYSSRKEAGKNHKEEEEIFELQKKFEIGIGKSCKKYQELYVKFIFGMADKIGQKRLDEYEDRISQFANDNYIDKICVGLRLEGLSYPKIIERLVKDGHPPVSWQAIQGRVERFKMKHLR